MKTHKLLTMFAAAACMMIFVMSISVHAKGLDGTYEGWYYATQGQTGITLNINSDGTGTFEFYNMPGKTNAKNGSYTVTVEEDNGRYQIKPDEWIERPSGYDFVSFDGVLENDVYYGTVSDNSSWSFKLLKNTQSYDNVQNSVFGNHRYEVIEEKMYWHDAEKYCESLGGHLVSIDSKEEQEYIQELLADYPDADYMIGTHRDLDGFTKWVTGDAITYSNWGTPQPDNLGGRQDTGVICNGKRTGGNYNIEKYQWDDNTNSQYRFICEWDTWSNSTEWSTEELQEASDNNLIPDTLVGKDMTQPITRGEFAAVSVKLFEAMTGGRAVMSSEAEFQDISDSENRNYILKAYNIDVVRGYSNIEYAPNSPIQREELATMLTRVYKKTQWPEWTVEKDDEYTINYSGVKKFDDDELISDYAKPSVYFLVKYNVLNGIGDNLFAPKNTTSAQAAMQYANATREQAIAMALRSFKTLK